MMRMRAAASRTQRTRTTVSDGHFEFLYGGSFKGESHQELEQNMEPGQRTGSKNTFREAEYVRSTKHH